MYPGLTNEYNSMKNWKKIIPLILINIIPVFLLLIHTLDLYDSIHHPGRYPFESEFFAPFSIYKSQIIYIAFTIITILSLMALIVSSVLKRWKLYYILLAINIILFVYPMLTNE